MKSQQIEQQILKILFALKEMNSSLTIMNSSWARDRPLNPTMLQTFVEQLHKLLQKTIGFSSVDQLASDPPIIQCIEQSFKSYQSQQQVTKQSNKQRAPVIKLQNQSGDPTQVDVFQLVNLNHELSQQNQQLTKRLQEAGSRVLALEDQIIDIQNKISYSRQDPTLSRQNKKLRIQLDRVQNLLSINNQQFIQQIQKYNQRIWRNQKQLQTYKLKLIEQRSQLQQRDFIINKLKLKNMDLQITSRARIKSESKAPTQRFKKIDVVGKSEIQFSRHG